MKFTPKIPPRSFKVGKEGKIRLNDCGRVELSPDEQVTFTTPSGTEYDVVRKEWGYYATPSLNQRLVHFHLHAALIKSPDGKYYVFLFKCWYTQASKIPSKDPSGSGTSVADASPK